MLKVVSFRASGEFAAFRDPSVTSNQTVYYIPSKTAIVGMLGAILGIERTHDVSETYGEPYRRLLRGVHIGLRLESVPEKVSFFTNHRSLKEAKVKPFKTELLMHPRYRVFISSQDELLKMIYDGVRTSNYMYPPYFGHAYCPATLSDPILQEVDEIGDLTFVTSCAILDESETYNKAFYVSAQPISEGSSLIIERHLHHFFEDGNLEARVLKFWIPVANSKYEITMSELPKLSKIIRLDGEDHACLF